MKIGSKIIVLGYLLALFGLATLFLYKLFPYSIAIPVGIGLVITGIFRNRGYYNKTYYLTSFSMIALFGLILVYIFIFMPNTYATDKNEFYIYIGLFIFIIIMFSRSYLRRENLKMPWKDEW